jgi:hypothetical protein
MNFGKVKGRQQAETGLRLALPKGHIAVGVSLPSPEDGNTSSFRNVVFSFQHAGRWTKSKDPVIMEIGTNPTSFSE